MEARAADPSPLEKNWELAMRLKEIISINDKRREVFTRKRRKKQAEYRQREKIRTDTRKEKEKISSIALTK